MQPSERTPGRGRPRTITRERIADVSIAIGLPGLTFVGVAAALGVSHMALYKHVPNIEALKCLVAEEIFQRWEIPQALGDAAEDLHAYLTRFAASVQAFVKAHPGLTPYVIRRLASTEAMIGKINDHQAHIAQTYGLSLEQARWVLSTVAFHGFAVADTVYTVSGREPVLEADRVGEELEMEVELEGGMKALIVGVLVILGAGKELSAKLEAWNRIFTPMIEKMEEFAERSGVNPATLIVVMQVGLDGDEDALSNSIRGEI